jgi:nucleoside-diphosphate-sugar epimerase
MRTPVVSRRPRATVHLAAQPPPPAHLLIASRSSIFGASSEMPYAETYKPDHQISLHAATKKASELMAHSYAHLYDVSLFSPSTARGGAPIWRCADSP